MAYLASELSVGLSSELHNHVVICGFWINLDGLIIYIPAQISHVFIACVQIQGFLQRVANFPF